MPTHTETHNGRYIIKQAATEERRLQQLPGLKCHMANYVIEGGGKNCNSK